MDALITGEDEDGFLHDPVIVKGYIRGVMMPRRCRVCMAPMVWFRTAFVCNGGCDGVSNARK